MEIFQHATPDLDCTLGHGEVAPAGGIGDPMQVRAGTRTGQGFIQIDNVDLGIAFYGCFYSVRVGVPADGVCAVGEEDDCGLDQRVPPF